MNPSTTLLFLAASAASASAAASEPAAHLETPSLVFSLCRMAGALALVFALFLGGVWLFRNWQRLTAQRGKTPKLNVLEVKSIGPRHALYVVAYEEQRFLLSSAPTGIAMLTALPPAAASEAAGVAAPAARPALSTQVPRASSFAETLAKMINPQNGKREGSLS
jgi:flagellar biogenesis protein FliO